MQQISPAETFPICRQITNHLETDTLYVRSVIKDAINDTVLATVDLVDKGSYYFRYNWKVVWDNTMARGRYITIVTSVYSDSGYTTKSENYGDEITTYLIAERWDAAKMQSMGGGGSYNGITAKDVRKVITEEIKKIEFPKQEKLKEIKFPKQIEYIRNFDELYEELQDIKARVGALPAQNSDLSPLMGKLDTLSKELKTKPVTPITNLTKVEKQLGEINRDTNNLVTETTKIKKDTKELVGDKRLTLNIQPIQMEVQSEQENGKSKEELAKIKKLKSKFGIK